MLARLGLNFVQALVFVTCTLRWKTAQEQIEPSQSHQDLQEEVITEANLLDLPAKRDSPKTSVAQADFESVNEQPKLLKPIMMIKL